MFNDSLHVLRMILVATAVIAVMVSLALSQWAAAAVLSVGVLVHGGATVWLKADLAKSAAAQAEAST